jgi:hypothetical protein
MADTEAPPAAVLPELTEMVDVYEAMVELSEEHLHRPVTVNINTWEDGTFRIRVFHQRRPTIRETLYYHSEEGVVRYGVEADDELNDEHVLTAIDPTADTEP